MHQSRTWLDLLREVIENSAERQRIAGILGVNPVTLTRWIEKRARPRAQNRQKLIDAMPAHMRQEFAALLALEYPEDMQRSSEAEEDPIADIPSAFYARTFDAYTSTPSSLRSSSIITIILQQMLAHLDVDQEGLFISVIRCTRPAPGQPVHSLQEEIGRGTAPFKPYQGLQPSFLGAESLAGSAIMQCARRVNQNLRVTTYAPALRTDLEESAMACPFTFEDRVAGCLLVSSTRLNFFTPKHQRLVQEYTNLLVLAMHPENFYEQSQIELVLMPTEREQQPFFQKFRQCVADILRHSGNEALSENEAEMIGYQEIEREIIQQANEQKIV